jgi:hypothetical protein
MHDYAIFGHDRSMIGRWIGFTSIILSGVITNLWIYAQSLTGWEAATKGGLTVGAIYFILNWAFNIIIWKIPVFKIPDLNGCWKINGITLDEDGSTKFNWSGTIGIEQNWKSILVHLKTATSQSKSYTATLSKRYGPIGGWLLSYSYRNEPELKESHELSAHKGYCEIEFDKKLLEGKAAYFNSGGRRTFGEIVLEKEID